MSSFLLVLLAALLAAFFAINGGVDSAPDLRIGALAGIAVLLFGGILALLQRWHARRVRRLFDGMPTIPVVARPSRLVAGLRQVAPIFVLLALIVAFVLYYVPQSDPSKPPLVAPLSPDVATLPVTGQALPLPGASLPITQVASEPAKVVTAPVFDAAGARREIEALVLSWAEAWSGRQVTRYLGFYGQDFTPAERISRIEWEDRRRQRITQARELSVVVDQLVVARLEPDRAEVRFRQHYSALGLREVSRKMLTLSREDGSWRIVREQSLTLSGG